MALHPTPSEAVRRLRRVADVLDSLASLLPPSIDQPAPILELLAQEVDACADALTPNPQWRQ